MRETLCRRAASMCEPFIARLQGNDAMSCRAVCIGLYGAAYREPVRIRLTMAILALKPGVTAVCDGEDGTIQFRCVMRDGDHSYKVLWFESDENSRGSIHRQQSIIASIPRSRDINVSALQAHPDVRGLRTARPSRCINMAVCAKHASTLLDDANKSQTLSHRQQRWGFSRRTETTYRHQLINIKTGGAKVICMLMRRGIRLSD